MLLVAFLVVIWLCDGIWWWWVWKSILYTGFDSRVWKHKAAESEALERAIGLSRPFHSTLLSFWSESKRRNLKEAAIHTWVFLRVVICDHDRVSKTASSHETAVYLCSLMRQICTIWKSLPKCNNVNSSQIYTYTTIPSDTACWIPGKKNIWTSSW